MIHMKRLFISLCIVVPGTILFYVIASSHEKYNEDEMIKYYLLTRGEIKESPRVSDDYYFEYRDRLDRDEMVESAIVFCKIKNFELAYNILETYIRNTGIPYFKNYPWSNTPEKFFYLMKTENKDGECLTLSLEVKK